MQIRTQDGDKSVSSAGVGGTGLGLGIAGTALGLLNGGLGNIFGGFGYNNNMNCPQVSTLQAELAREKSERYADQVGIEVYKAAVDFYNKNNEDIVANNKQVSAQLAAIDKSTAVSEATTNAQIACMQNQINQLFGLTKLVVPNNSVCPGWGNVTITPATTTTAA